MVLYYVRAEDDTACVSQVSVMNALVKRIAWDGMRDREGTRVALFCRIRSYGRASALKL